MNLQWHSDAATQESFEEFTVQAKAADNEFKDIDCQQIKQTDALSGLFECEIEAVELMGNTFGLYYGD